MLAVLKQRNFLLLWSAGLISMAGDWALFTALPIYVYTLTASPLATSLMFASELVPSLVFGSVAGVFVDRWPRQRIMLLSNLLLAITLLPLLLVHSVDRVWIVYVVGFVQSTIAQFFNPAEAAVLPTLVGEELLVSANSLSSLNRHVARLVGPAIGGFIAVSSGLAGVTLIDAASFAVAAGLVALLVMPPARQVAPTTLEDAEAAFASVWRQWVEGLLLVRNSTGLSVLIGLFTLTSVGEGVFGTMFVIWIKQVLHGSALQFGWFMSAQAIGGILGGVAIGAVGSRVIPTRLAWMGALSFGLLDIALFSYPLLFTGIWIGLAIIILVGVPGAAAASSFLTLFQVATPDAFRGRIFGAVGTTSALAQLIGTLIAGTVGGIVGPIALLNVFQGGTYLLAGGCLFLTSAHMTVSAGGRSDSPAQTSV